MPSSGKEKRKNPQIHVLKKKKGETDTREVVGGCGEVTLCPPSGGVLGGVSQPCTGVFFGVGGVMVTPIPLLKPPMCQRGEMGPPRKGTAGGFGGGGLPSPLHVPN